MIIVTTENIANHRIVEIKGPAFGLTVRARGLGKDITAALKGLVGGEG
ncbi:heavy metal-binding domain-containing protein, partial [Cohnella sp. REN36]